MLILSSMDDGTSRRVYEKRLLREFQYVREQILPLFNKLYEMAKASQRDDLVQRLKELKEGANYISKLSIVEGMIQE